MDIDGVISRLKRQVERAGGGAAWCRDNDTSPGYLSEVINGTRVPGPKILDAIGVERVDREPTYRLKPKP